ncbi:MAG: hypothetical protein ACFB22_14795 [Rhodothalassiaceae bacterium]
MALAIACLLGLAGALALFRAWSVARAARTSALLVGWGLIAAALLLGGYAAGDGGIVVGVLAVMTAALVVIMVRAGRAQAANRHVRTVSSQRGAGASGARGLIIGGRDVLLAGPGAGLVALAGALAAHRLLAAIGLARADAIVAGFFALPLIWAALATLVTVIPTLHRQCFWFAATAAPAVVLLWLMPGGR